MLPDALIPIAVGYGLPLQLQLILNLWLAQGILYVDEHGHTLVMQGSHPNHADLQVLFRTVRYLTPAKQRKPAVVHINYHVRSCSQALTLSSPVYCVLCPFLPAFMKVAA